VALSSLHPPGFFETFKYLGIPVVWTDLWPRYSWQSSGPAERRSLLLLHGFAHSGYDGNDRRARHEIDRKYSLNFEVFVNKASASSDQWDTVTYFDKPSKTLHQPWGTNLLEERFRAPVISRSPFVFWVGAIWNNDFNQVNIAEIDRCAPLFAKGHLGSFI
jgi:hypothetical protein